MASFRFKVDSALLRELGERLVGKPHIALAELVKNSFDADATDVIIRLQKDCIEVEDNGHGMTKQEFDDFWMRIGSTHKSKAQRSRNFGRPLTGSKGVGRLAGQLLAKKMAIITTSEVDPERVLIGSVNWDRAIENENLTEAKVGYMTKVRNRNYVRNSKWGTRIVLLGLNQRWTDDAIEDLAREIWWLTPPFRTNRQLESEQQRTFNVTFEAQDSAKEQAFARLMHAIFDLWNAKLVGRLERNSDGVGHTDLVLEWKDGDRRQVTYEVSNCKLHSAEFEVRIYHLQRRQAHGISVHDARKYLNAHGNVHIYDASFHLPYYGPKVDWLRVEFDHAHRLSTSKLLPDSLQVQRGMNYLPTQSRLLGVVNVDTGLERRQAEAEGTLERGDHLAIQISRDRLVDNKAFHDLVHLVRWALDFYAMEEAKREFSAKEASRDTAPAVERFRQLEDVIADFSDRIDANAYAELKENVEEAVVAAEEESRKLERHAGLLGALATAGISAVAYQHEHRKQLQLLEHTLRRLRAVKVSDESVTEQLRLIIIDMERWLEHSRGTQLLFQSLSNAQNREKQARLRAKELIHEVSRQLKPLLRDVEIEFDGVQEDLRLPRGTFAEWSALFQNVFLNAANAMVDSDQQLISVSSRKTDKKQVIIVQDTGAGVDLEHASELFEPFVRRLEISRERQALGYGGTGLGLTIARMMADALSCRVDFVQPDQEFSTAFRVSWKEME